jgi:hypothetical protein
VKKYHRLEAVIPVVKTLKSMVIAGAVRRADLRKVVNGIKREISKAKAEVSATVICRFMTLLILHYQHDRRLALHVQLSRSRSGSRECCETGRSRATSMESLHDPYEAVFANEYDNLEVLNPALPLPTSTSALLKSDSYSCIAAHEVNEKFKAALALPTLSRRPSEDEPMDAAECDLNDKELYEKQNLMRQVIACLPSIILPCLIPFRQSTSWC